MRTGYGKTSYQNKQVRAHRLAFFFAFGFMPQQFVLHACDNRLCVNPQHLREGDNQANMRDKVSRNRQRKGESCNLSKLTSDDVIQIKRLLQSGASQNSIAAQFGVDQSNISNIQSGKTWLHVTEEGGTDR